MFGIWARAGDPTALEQEIEGLDVGEGFLGALCDRDECVDLFVQLQRFREVALMHVALDQEVESRDRDFPTLSVEVPQGAEGFSDEVGIGANVGGRGSGSL